MCVCVSVSACVCVCVSVCVCECVSACVCVVHIIEGRPIKKKSQRVVAKAHNLTN